MRLTTILRDYLSFTNDAIAVAYRGPDEDIARFVHVNASFTALFGHAAAQVIDRGVDLLHDAESWSDFVAAVGPRFGRGETGFAVEAGFLRADGDKFWGSVSVFMVDDPETGGWFYGASFRYISDLDTGKLSKRAALAERDRALARQARMDRERDSIQTRLFAAMNAYPDPFVIYDKDMRLVICNSAYRRSMSDDPALIHEGMHIRDVLRQAIRSGRMETDGSDPDTYIERVLSRASNRQKVEDLEFAGDVHHRVLRSYVENGDMVIIRLDATELVRQRRQAAAMQDRILAALNAYPEPFTIYDSRARLVLWNDAFANSVTDDPNELSVGMDVGTVMRIGLRNDRFPEAEGREEDWLRMVTSLDEITKPFSDIELPGDIHHRVLRTRAPNGDTVVIRLNTTEVVRQRRALEQYAARLEAANQKILFKALHDELTGLGNRRYLSEKFDLLVQRRALQGGELAALHIDLDRFKQINDTIGHAAGDKVLMDTAERIRANVREDEVVARIGGDEFIIVLHVDADSTRPEHLAQALIRDLSRPSFFDGRACRFGASIGLARTPLADTGDLLTNSDVALYKAKRAGRGQIGIFDRSDLYEVRRTVALADDIMRGVEAGEFVPFYQPQVDARTGKVVALEALVRWLHPKRGVVPPAGFLKVATDLDVVADIDRMVFETAIAECQTAFGHRPDPPSLSFNVSAKRILDAEVDEISRHAGAYGGSVSFELLETIFLEEESDSFLFQLDRLRDMGLSIEVDDFGSGRASVVALQRIGPDRMKIDRRLVAPIAGNPGALRLLRSIVEIGNAMGIGVTAEGIETPEQARLLVELGCDRLQGFHIAQPMSFADLCDFLRRHGLRIEGAPPVRTG